MNISQTFSKILFISFLLVSSCSFFKSQSFVSEDGGVTIHNVTQNRDMSKYEFGGHFNSRWKGTSPKNGEKNVRDFIWNHWIQKKRGYVKMTSSGVDTASTIHYFIEPNEKNEWQIARRFLYNHSIDEYNNQPVRDDVVTVDRIATAKESDDWQIVFKSKDNETLDSLPSL